MAAEGRLLNILEEFLRWFVGGKRNRRRKRGKVRHMFRRGGKKTGLVYLF